MLEPLPGGTLEGGDTPSHTPGLPSVLQVSTTGGQCPLRSLRAPQALCYSFTFWTVDGWIDSYNKVVTEGLVSPRPWARREHRREQGGPGLCSHGTHSAQEEAEKEGRGDRGKNVQRPCREGLDLLQESLKACEQVGRTDKRLARPG